MLGAGGSNSIFGGAAGNGRRSPSRERSPLGRLEPIILRRRMRIPGTTRETDASVRLNEDLEDFLSELTDEYGGECLMARHRRAGLIAANEVLLYVERQWNMYLRGIASNDGPRLRAVLRRRHYIEPEPGEEEYLPIEEPEPELEPEPEPEPADEPEPAESPPPVPRRNKDRRARYANKKANNSK